MQDFCEVCDRDGLTLAYAPEYCSFSVPVCCRGGLVQSRPRIDFEWRVASDHVRLIDPCSNHGCFVEALGLTELLGRTRLRLAA